MEDRFSKEIEIMKNKQVEMLEMKTSINEIQATVVLLALVLSADKIKQNKQ
jgi:hypothetical protein